MCVSSFPCYLDSRGAPPHITVHQHHVCPQRETESVSGTRRGGNDMVLIFENEITLGSMSFDPIVLSDYQSGQ